MGLFDAASCRLAPVQATGEQVTKIWERLYLGNLKDAEKLARFNPQRITTVLSLCRDQAVHRAPKITYIHIPIPDSLPISAQNFEDIMFAMAIGLRRGNLLVHCLAGMNRSPIMVAAWLHRCGYKGVDKALSEIGELRDLATAHILLSSVKHLLGQ
jgi:protein-tyrosine phosphatase